MFTRRQFLNHTLKASSLVALGSVVPQFVARTAQAAAPGKDSILVVLEMNGGNDGLNTVIPYADDLYHKYRPTLRRGKDSVIRLDDRVGLHSSMQGFQQLWEQGRLAVLQGVGYPNPNRSHFEAMDIWQSADPDRRVKTGWLGRATAEIKNSSGSVPLLHIGRDRLPLALEGTGGGAVSIHSRDSFRLDMAGGEDGRHSARRRLMEELATPATGETPVPHAGKNDLAAFVQRRQVQTLTAVETVRELLGGGDIMQLGDNLSQKLQLIAALIAKGFGTRIFYLSFSGFDTHAGQGPMHANLLSELAGAVAGFFRTLKGTKDDGRVRLMTFSEFGRRVRENDSRGTDHGAASCMFVAGPSIKGGVVGSHPSLSDLDAGDLKFHTDFRRVYATLLDGWLGCDSKAVLETKWDHLKELKAKS